MSIRTAERYDDNDYVVPAGHVASRDIRIIVSDINSYSAVIQALVDVGISEITSVGSDVSDYEALQKKALAKAAQAAREKAGHPCPTRKQAHGHPFVTPVISMKTAIPDHGRTGPGETPGCCCGSSGYSRYGWRNASSRRAGL